jgi:cytochrome c-type biogenesis protein CcmF
MLIAFAFDAVRQGKGGFWRGVIPALRTHRRQYAAYAIHLAFVCLAVGVTGSSLGTRRHEVQIKEGETIEWAGRRIEFVKLNQRETDEMLVAEVELRVGRGRTSPVTLMPARHFHQLQNEWTSEVAIHSSWTADFYVILNAGLGDGQVALTFIENPLMRWIWVRGWLAAAGVAVVAWPTRQQSLFTEADRVDLKPPRETIPATRPMAA